MDDISVPALGVTLKDFRTLDVAVRQESMRIAVEILARDALSEVRPETILCGPEEVRRENQLYGELANERIVAGLPGLTWQEFEELAGDDIVEDESSCDRRLPTLQLAVIADDGTNIGEWAMYNVKLERDDVAGITASAMAFPGCNVAPRKSLRETWSGIMSFILANDLHSGIRVIDFIEWRLPTRKAHEW